MWGVLPLRLRIRFNPSVRAFCERSLRIVHLHETLACKMSYWELARRNGVCRAISSSPSRESFWLIASSATGFRQTTISG